jgi:hypothetical protein
MRQIISALLLIAPVSAYAGMGVSVVPEPGVLSLLVAGVAVAVAVKFMKRNK